MPRLKSFRVPAATNFVLAGLVSLIAIDKPALADCSPDPAPNGGTVTCSGVDADGFITGSNPLTINIEPEAVVSRIAFAANVTLTNEGTIQLGGSVNLDALDAGYSDSIVTNNGLISAETDANSSYVTGVRLNASNTLINNGDIVSSDSAQTSRAFGVWEQGVGNTIENYGLIDVRAGRDAYGISSLTHSDINNVGTIMAQAFNGDAIGVQVDYDVNLLNQGRIEATATDIAVGVSVGRSSTITNQSEIVADGGEFGIGISVTGSSTDITTINNSGTITADYAIIGQHFSDSSGGIEHVTNSGTLNGDVLLRRRSDQFTNMPTGVVNGMVDLGDGADYFENLQGGWIVSDVDGVKVTDGSTVMNAGVINADSNGIVANDSNEVVNSGIIHSVQAGVDAGVSNLIVNEGEIQADINTIAAGRAGSDAGNTIMNSGSLDGGTNAILIRGGHHEISNAGTISGAISAINVVSGEVALENTGTINGNLTFREGDDTVELGHGSMVDGEINGGVGHDVVTNTGDGTYLGRFTGVEELSVENGNLSLILTGVLSEIGMTTISEGAGLRVEGGIDGSLVNNGTLSFGDGAGSLGLTGNFEQSPAGNIFVVLADSFHNEIAVQGTATLSGNLATGLRGVDFEDILGQTFRIVGSAGGISGTFAQEGIFSEGFWTLEVVTDANEVKVTIVDINPPAAAGTPIRAAWDLAVRNASQREAATVDSQTVQALSSLSYDSLGDWAVAAAPYIDNFDSIAASPVDAADMPTTGSATFEGTTQGELTEAGASGIPEAYVVEGNVLLSANFANGLIDADFTGMQKISVDDGLAQPWVDFQARMSLIDGTSQFAGEAGTEDGTWTGDAQGGFFGESDSVYPDFAAGLWRLSGPTGSALGGFLAGRK